MPSTSPIIDELILDYLLYNCISALLAEWSLIHPLNEDEDEEQEEEKEYDPQAATASSQPGHRRQLERKEAARKADRSLLIVNCIPHLK